MIKRIPLGQLAFPELIPDSFWVVTQGHGVILDGSRFLAVEDYGNGWWLAWRDGIKPLSLGTLLKERHFQREKDIIKTCKHGCEH